MNKSKRPSRQKVTPVPEKALAFVKGAGEDPSADASSLKNHVDNPGQTPMKDGSP
jgi:hypothetical protein